MQKRVKNQKEDSWFYSLSKYYRAVFVGETLVVSRSKMLRL